VESIGEFWTCPSGGIPEGAQVMGRCIARNEELPFLCLKEILAGGEEVSVLRSELFLEAKAGVLLLRQALNGHAKTLGQLLPCRSV